MNDPTLPGFESTPPLRISPDRARTERRRRMLDRGVLPATGLPLFDTGETCGSCVHHLARGWRGRSYHKCLLAGVTAGPATDIRVSWPACTAWDPR